jgi:hypothetical protein
LKGAYLVYFTCINLVSSPVHQSHGHSELRTRWTLGGNHHLTSNALEKRKNE